MAWEDLPKLREGNYVNLMNAYARQIHHKGIRHRKEHKAGRWQKNRPEKDDGIVFSTRLGLISGPTPRVTDLALDLATEALEAGDENFATLCVDTLKALPDEIRRRVLVSEYKRKLDSLAR